MPYGKHLQYRDNLGKEFDASAREGSAMGVLMSLSPARLNERRLGRKYRRRLGRRSDSTKIMRALAVRDQSPLHCVEMREDTPVAARAATRLA